MGGDPSHGHDRIGHNHGGVHLALLVEGLAFGQCRHGTSVQGGIDKGVAIGELSGLGHKEGTGADLTGVGGDGGDHRCGVDRGGRPATGDGKDILDGQFNHGT